MKSEEIFYKLVQEGFFRVHKNGEVYKTMKFSPKIGNPPIKIKPKRTGYVLPNGYYYVSFQQQKKSYKCYIHRLVYRCFIGPIKKNLVIDRINHDPSDNSLENLQAISYKENLDRCPYKPKGETHGIAKLTLRDVLLIRKRFSEGETQTSISKDFPIGRRHVGDIVNRKVWAHV